MKHERPYRPAGRSFSLACLAVAAAWHAVWLFGIMPPSQAFVPPPRVQAPTIRFTRTGVNDIPLSPLLIALPTRAGFSGLAFRDRMHVKSTDLKPSAGVSFVLDRVPPTRALLQEATNGESTAQWLTRDNDFNPHTDAPPVFATGQDDFDASALVVEARDGLAQDLFANVPSSAESWVATVQPFRVSAVLEADRYGRVTHVFLEDPSQEPAIARRLVTMIFTWRLVPTGAPLKGRVTVKGGMALR